MRQWQDSLVALAERDEALQVIARPFSPPHSDLREPFHPAPLPIPYNFSELQGYAQGHKGPYPSRS